MRQLLRCCKKAEFLCALWIAACFSLASGAYLTWLYRLMELTDARRVDFYSMVVGYSIQALGLGAAGWLYSKKPSLANGRTFALFMVAFALVTLPALLGNTLAGVLIFGFLMHLMIGGLAGFYLCSPTMLARDTARGKVFGFGYGISTIFVFLLSLFRHQQFLRAQGVYIVYLALAALSAWVGFPLLRQAQARAAEAEPRTVQAPGSQTIALAIVTVLLLSLVKNMGFSFPSSDVSSGVSLELSRLFYAIGLIAAGVITDRNRKYGAICTVAAMVIPFVMLALSNESIPAIVCWALDYLFYGFFSVFRVVLFMDLAAQSGRWHLAVWGLLAGRIGDALGTGLFLVISFSRLMLICCTLVLFFITLLLFLRLCQRLYMPEATQAKSEREVFESFAIQHDLSAREREVLRLVLAEQSVPQIAETLFVTESTVRYHVHNLLQKSGCKSRQELVKSFHLMLYPQIAERPSDQA